MIRYKDFVDFLRLFWQQQKQIMYRLLKKNREFFHSEARILWWCLNHRGHLLYKMWQKIFHQPHRHNGHLIPRNHLIYSHYQRLQRNCSRFLKTVFHQPPLIPSAIIVEAVLKSQVFPLSFLAPIGIILCFSPPSRTKKTFQAWRPATQVLCFFCDVCY